MTKKNVYAINWTEYERGWGSRPDGHTLHLTLEDAQDHIKDYWARQPAAENGHAPDDYSAPGLPSLVEIEADVFQQIVNKGFVWGHHTRWV